MIFRSITRDDVDGVIELWAAAGVGGGTDVDRAEIVERQREDDGFFVVAEDHHGRIVAAAMGCYDNHRGWLKRVAVSPGQRGGGIGRELVAIVEERFFEAGITKLRLAVWSDNEVGGAFWETLGYEELPEIRYFTKDLNAD